MLNWSDHTDMEDKKLESRNGLLLPLYLLSANGLLHSKKATDAYFTLIINSQPQ